MSAAPLEHHVGPWTEADYLALGERSDRIELIDGSLMMTPAAASDHQQCARRLANLLEAAAPSTFEIVEAVNVRVAPGRILIPDVVVTARLGRVVTYEADEVPLVVEIASPATILIDRTLKADLYATAGIETYLRVELTEPAPVLRLYRLERGTYVEAASSRQVNRLVLDKPFPVAVAA